MTEREREIAAVLRAVVQERHTEFSRALAEVTGLSITDADLDAMARAVVGPLEQATRRFPIQRGPDVPWEVMAPHESQAQRNHGQSLARLAERGGLGTGEAWAVVNGLHWHDMEKAIGWAEADRLWRQYAERVNLHYEELERLRAALADRDAHVARLGAEHLSDIRKVRASEQEHTLRARSERDEARGQVAELDGHLARLVRALETHSCWCPARVWCNKHQSYHCEHVDAALADAGAGKERG